MKRENDGIKKVKANKERKLNRDRESITATIHELANKQDGGLWIPVMKEPQAKPIHLIEEREKLEKADIYTKICKVNNRLHLVRKLTKQEFSEFKELVKQNRWYDKEMEWFLYITKQPFKVGSGHKVIK